MSVTLRKQLEEPKAKELATVTTAATTKPITPTGSSSKKKGIGTQDNSPTPKRKDTPTDA